MAELRNLELSDIVPSATDFLQMSTEAAATVLLRVARARSEQSVFSAADLVMSTPAAGAVPVTVYGGRGDHRLLARVDLALQWLVHQGALVPAYTSGRAGDFRIVNR